MNIEKERNDIKKRNKNVELNKAWETSFTRKICIMILTYIVVIIYSYVIKEFDNMGNIEKYYDNTESEKPRKNVQYFIEKVKYKL